jgi:hypothetical protein
MDDFSVTSLSESKNEWCARLLNILTPTITQGLKSIFDEAWKLCQDNKETDKYLMTFQNFLTRVPKWNPTIIDNEKTRIIETSGCTYLEELITCVHIIQLKALTCVRVGSKQKKIDINVPVVSDFIHKIYIHVARKIYTNIYLFEKNIAPLLIQKNNREIEITVKECILNAIRDSVPVEHILRAYMDETEEQDVEVKEVEEALPEPVPAATAPAPAQTEPSSTAIDKSKIEEYKKTTEEDKDFIVESTSNSEKSTSNSESKISFADNDILVDDKGLSTVINTPKDEKSLEEIEKSRSLSSFGDDDDDDESERLTIGENITLDVVDVNDLNSKPTVDLKPPVLDFEILH